MSRGDVVVGMLRADKPEGYTSHDLVRIVRRVAGVRRVGHAGTLDPFATGLLPIAVGWATRLLEYVVGLSKVYRGVIRLGERTRTDDPTGAVVDRTEGWRELEPERIRSALEAQVGEIVQRPPVYSAKKVDGRRAYALARGGDHPRMRPERVRIHRIAVLEVRPPDVRFEVECSSGTYVRAIARDLGDALGVGGHLRELRRLRVGPFGLEGAIRLDSATPRDRVLSAIEPPESAVAHLRRVDVGDEQADSLCHGRPIDWSDAPNAGPVAVHRRGRLAAIAEWEEGRLRPRKVFLDS